MLTISTLTRKKQHIKTGFAVQVEKRGCRVQVEKAEVTQRTRGLVMSGKSPGSA